MQNISIANSHYVLQKAIHKSFHVDTKGTAGGSTLASSKVTRPPQDIKLRASEVVPVRFVQLNPSVLLYIRLMTG
jgi:hypothetical protein